ncbi:MAG TPA: ABC transporter ATP-binding protein [Segetibacter sp.]|jgi:ABC-type sugar transport system ATPase subunit
MSLLSVLNVSKQQQGVFVLRDVSLIVDKFKKIAIAGETGSGKSTLLKIAAGLIQTDAGQVFFENERVLGPEEKLLPGHPAIAYLSQHFELRNNYRVEEILEMANKMPDEEADTIYKVCRIRHLLKRKTDQLSGGEKQRIALARLLISFPRLLILDEPYSNLDMIHKRILKDVINDICEKLKTTCILISHDPADTLSWADEIHIMKGGQIIQKATPANIYYKPISEYAAALFGKYNLLSSSASHHLIPLKDWEFNGKKLFVRPEDFRIVADQNDSISGIIQKIIFVGNSYELIILLENETITVRTIDSNYRKGQQVHLILSAKSYWYL